MEAKQRINELMSTPMDRVGFLKVLAGLIIAAVGLSRFIAVIDKAKALPSSHDDAMAGYGGSPYGK